jgi:hypothetical protein
MISIYSKKAAKTCGSAVSGEHHRCAGWGRRRLVVREASLPEGWLGGFVSLLIIVLGVAAPSAQANYVLHHPRKQHCKAHYTRRLETVEHREHNHRVVVRETVCIYAKRKLKPTSTVLLRSPALPAGPALVVKLHAHLDSSFVQDPSNPFQVTYSFSATATQTVEGLTLSSEPVPLPAGVLTLYNNGVLACSVHVSGTFDSGECPVEYKELGSQTVTTVYASGQISVTETNIEHVEPENTSTTVTAKYAPYESSSIKHLTVGEIVTWTVGDIEINAISTTPSGGPIIVPGSNMSPVPARPGFCESKRHQCLQPNIAETDSELSYSAGDLAVHICTRNKVIIGMHIGEEPGNSVSAVERACHETSIAEAESGQLFTEANLEAVPGYNASTSGPLPIQFVPELKEPAEA